MVARTVKVDLVATIGKYTPAVEKAASATDKLRDKAERFARGRYNAKLGVDAAAAGRKVTDLERELEKLAASSTDVKVNLDSDDAKRRLGDVQADLARLGRTVAEARATVDDAEGQAKLSSLESKLLRLGAATADPKIDLAGVAEAEAGLGAVQAGLTRLDGQTVHAKVKVDTDTSIVGIAMLARALKTLGIPAAVFAATPALVSLGSSAVQASAGVALLPAVLGSAGIAAGTLKVGLSGVGDTLKALSKADDAAATTATASGKARAAAADAVRSAQDGLASAQRSADRTAIQGAAQVADARRSLADAQISGARQVAAAQQDLTRAQDQGRAAQLDLTRAWKEGQEQLEDFALTLRGAALDEEEAVDRLEEARARLESARSGGAGAEEMDDLARAVRRAELGVDLAAERMGDLREQQQEWARSGVAGSDAVVSAQRRVADSAQGVRDAEAGLFHARQDQRKQVEDAQRSLSRAVQQAGWAQADATRQVTDAQRQLATAMAATGEAGGAAAAKAAAEMAKLSPAAKDLVSSIRSLGPAWTDLRLDVQEKLLTGVGSQVNALGDRYLPVLRTALGDTATSFNTAFKMSADFLNLPSTVTDISVATGNVTTGLDNASRAAKPLLAAFVDLYVVGSEFMPALGQSTADVAERFADFIEEARKTGQLKGWIQDSIDVLNQLGRITGNVGGILGSSFDAVDRSGKSFLTTLEEMTERLDTTLDTPEGGAALQEFFTTTRELTRGFIAHLVQLWPAIQAGAGAFAALVREGAPLATVITDLVVSGLVPLLNTIEVLSPLLGPIAVQMLAMNLAAKALAGSAALASGAFAAFAPSSVMGRMAGFRAGMDTAALSAGTLTERLTRNATAGENVALAGSKVGVAASRVASALPIAGLAAIGLGAAYDAVTVSASEAADAMAQGGAVAQTALQKLVAQSVHSDLPLIGKVFDLITTDLEEYGASVKGVEQAQLNAAIAQNNWTVQINRFGANSPQAMAAQAALAGATGEVQRQQQLAADATKSHTDRMIEQRDQMLGSLNAEIAYQAALDQATEAIARNGATLDLNTAEGRESATALNAMAMGAIRHLESMNQQGAGLVSISIKEGEYRRQLIETAMAAGKTREAAEAYVDQLHLVPGRINTTITADTGPARQAIDDFLRSARGQEIVIKARADTGSITAGATPYRGRACGGIDTMAAGGVRSMRRDVAQVVPPNQPVLMGDRMRGKEYFLPDDDSPRTMAIGARWASDRGLRLIPMARGGMIQAEDGSWVPPSFYANPVTKPSQKRLDYLAGKGAATGEDPRKLAQLQQAADAAREALQGLRAEGLDPLSPAFKVVNTAVNTATTAMTGSIGALQLASNTSWADMRTKVGAEVGTMVGPHLGALHLAHRATEASTARLQALTGASWAGMTATTGQQVGAVTGPIFGGLHSGMSGVEHHGATMAAGWRVQLDRLRAAAADPIRWVMQFPLGPPGIAASWNTLDDQFKLGKRVHPPAPNFAEGGAVHGAGTTTSDSIEARLSRDEHVWTAQEVDGAGGHEQVAGMREAASRGVLKYYRDGGPVPGFAAGGPVYQHLFGLVRGRFPQASLNSGYRAGDPGQHGKGKAVDLGQQGRAGGRGHPYLADMNRWIHDTYGKGTRALIYSGAGDDRPDLLNGRPHPYGAATDAGHKNHVHWDVNNIGDLVGGGILGGIGGAGGGAAFDPGPAVEAAFKRTYDMIGDMRRFFGDSAFATGTQSVARQSADAVKAKAMEAIAATMGAAGLGPLGAGAAFYVGEISRAAKARRMGADGATIGTATALVESNLKMYANRKVPASMSLPHDAVGSDHDSVGLFQQRQAGWGTLEQRMNPYASAGLFFDRLSRFNWRAMDPGAAAQRVQVSAFPGRYSTKMGQARGLVTQHGGMFDDGGDWPPNTWGLNRSGQTEHVLKGPERAGFLRLVETITTQRSPAVPRAVPIPANPAAPAGSGGGGEVTQNFYIEETTNPESTAAKISRRQAFTSRLR